MSHSVVSVDGTDWVEPILVWLTTYISLCKYLRKLVENARSNSGLQEKQLLRFLDDESFEKMGTLMCENNWKLLGLDDELPMFFSQINVFRGQDLSDSHELALQLYSGSQLVKNSCAI